MIIRLILSLAFIGGVLFFAARVAKKRGLGQGNGLIEVVARQRMGRTSSVNVVRIGDVVLVVGATEEHVTLLAEVDAEAVETALQQQRPPAAPAGGQRRRRVGRGRRAGRPRSPPARWPARSSTAPAGARWSTSCASGRCAAHDRCASFARRRPAPSSVAGRRWSRCSMLASAVLVVLLAGPASAAPSGPVAPTAPTAPVVPGAGNIGISVGNGSPSSSITLILAITVLSIAPSVLLLCTSFTKIIVVLGLTRNALGLPTSPPNQVLTGIALFLTLFVMGPVFSNINDVAVQPYMNGKLSVSQAYDKGVVPLQGFLLKNTRQDELKLMIGLSGEKKPASAKDVSMTTLIPAFVLSELKSAFIIGLVVFIPFLVLDMLVSAALMAMGMMMVPPTIVSLPFKLLLFVMVDGWGLITTALVGSYTGSG